MIQNLLKLLFLGLLLCLMFNCSKENKSEQSKLSKLDSVTLSAVDTIKVKYSGQLLLLTDVRNGKLAYFDFFSKDILVSDTKGNILSQFNGSLLGAESFGDHVYGVNFHNDSVLSVLSDKGYFLYGFSGKMMKKYLHPFIVEYGVYMNGDFNLSYDLKRRMFISLLTTNTDMPSNKPEFFQQARHITTFKTDSMKYSWNIPYEPESSYLQKDYYTGEWNVHYDVNEDTIAIVFGRDPIVYYYNLENFKKISSFKTEPEHFKQEVKFAFGSDTYSDHKKRLTSYANSDYRRIFLQGDTTLTSYTAGIPLEVFDGIKDLNDYNNIGYRSQRYFMQLFINSKKIVSDVELPREFPLLMEVSDGSLYLGEQERWQNKNDGYKRFLVCKMSRRESIAKDQISMNKLKAK